MKKLAKIILGIVFVISSMAFVAACHKTTYYDFLLNDGTQTTTVKVEEGSDYSLPEPQAREGYEFEGWYLDSGYTGSAVQSIKAEKGETFYAKWTKLHKITLELNGGALPQSVLYLKDNANVSDFMKNYTPSKNGLEFGGWFLDGKELPKTTVIKADIALSAKYKVGYTVELWGQNSEKTEYVKVADDIKGTAFAGEAFTSTQTLAGFKEIAHANTKTSTDALSENAAQNVFKHYFDRQELTVSFVSNYPDGTEDTTADIKVVYGQEVTVPYDYSCDGYYLAGWSTSSLGGLDYRVNYIDTLIYNKEDGADTEVKADKFIPDKEITVLYAVWSKSYTNMFGGDDSIIILDAEDTDIYLSRGGLLFKGTYSPSRQEFTFRYDGNIVLEGKLIDDETYAYFSSVRYDTAATLYKVTENGLEEDSSTKILLDEYNGITYYVIGEDGKTSSSEGTYVFDEDGNYVVTFTSGDLSGKEMILSVSTVKVNGADITSFSIRNEEEYNLGTLIRFEYSSNGFMNYSNGVFDLTLTGFGTALYNNGNGVVNWYYIYDGAKNTISLMNSVGESMGVVRIIKFGATTGYIYYDETLDQTFVTESGVRLKLDGMYEATYVKGSTSLIGTYTATESVFGGTIIIFEGSGNTRFTFMLTEEKSEDDKEAEPTYTLTEKANGYAEYNYSENDSVYYAPLFVLNDTADGQAIIYGYTAAGKYVKVSEGTYASDEVSGHYKYTALTIDDSTEAMTSPLNIARIQSVIFDTGVTSRYYEVNYWFSHTTVTGVTKTYGDVYNSTEGATLQLVGGFAIYTKGNETYSGYAAVSGDGKTVTVYAEIMKYFELGGDKTFVELTFKPYSAYAYSTVMTLSNQYVSAVKGTRGHSILEVLDFDGKGNATFKTVKSEDGEEEVISQITGTVTLTDDKTEDGAEIYKFESTEKTFLFIRFSNDTSALAYYEQYDGFGKTFTSSGEGTLKLDGFGRNAVYTDKDGKEYKGEYLIVAEGTIALITESDDIYYFDLSGNSFTARGEEYGEYVVVDNWGSEGLYLGMDGHGRLRVYTIDEDNGTETSVDVNGTYEVQDELYTLRYTSGGASVTLSGTIGYYSFRINGESVTGAVFVKMHEEVIRTYVNNQDWSVLVLDSLGVATKYTEDGKVQTGRYILVTDELLYYVAPEEADSCIYKYTVDGNTVEPVKLSAVGYYTDSLNSIVFTRTGFAEFNGADEYFYNIENGKVVVYKQDSTSPDASTYGFVREVFGNYPFEKQITYKGERYIINNGTEVVFNREGNEYPVPMSSGDKAQLGRLSFAPSGEDEFSVNGIIQLNGNSRSCRVFGTRDDGVLSLTLIVDSYSFDIEVVYKGEDDKGQTLSTYTVTGMQGHMTLYPIDYLNFYYQVSIFYGPAYTQFVINDHGIIDVVQAFDEDGNETSRYIDAEFLAGSGMNDLRGNPISISGADYENKSGSRYIVSFTGEDGYEYKIYFDLERHSALGAYGYYIIALARLQTIESGDYTLEVERAISTMDGDEFAGKIFSANLKNGEEEIPYWNIVETDDAVYYVSRTETDGKFVSTKYFKLTLTDAPTGEIGAEGAVIIPVYADTFGIEEVQISTLYSENGKSYADITSDNKVLFINFAGDMYVISGCEYDADTSTYTVTSDYEKFTVKVNGENVEITEAE